VTSDEEGGGAGGKARPPAAWATFTVGFRFDFHRKERLCEFSTISTLWNEVQVISTRRRDFFLHAFWSRPCTREAAEQNVLCRAVL
jgi:hypothetical protein